MQTHYTSFTFLAQLVKIVVKYLNHVIFYYNITWLGYNIIFTAGVQTAPEDSSPDKSHTLLNNPLGRLYYRTCIFIRLSMKNECTNHAISTCRGKQSLAKIIYEFIYCFLLPDFDSYHSSDFYLGGICIEVCITLNFIVDYVL